MVPFAIAGVQIHVPAMKSNIETVIHKLDITMARFPWVQMVLFSELALCGPVPKDPVTLPGEAEHALQAAAARHGIGATKRQEVR